MRRMRGRRIAAACGLVLIGLAVVASAGWAGLALSYGEPGVPALPVALVALFVALGCVALIALPLPRWRWRLLAAYAVAFIAVLVWWRGIEPSNDRDWQTDVALLPSATIDGDLVTMHHVRNFDYRTETDYTPAYYDKTYDLRQLTGVDLVAVYWMGPAIAHTFLSFEFAGTDHLAISIETRKKKGDAYSTLKGFFRQYELYYVVADERDVIRLRTNYRRDPPEETYVYRVNGDLDNARRVFLEYVRHINALNARPEFYNTVTSNCTTDIWANTRVNANHVPLSWQILATGYVPRYLYDDGRIDTSIPFDELKERVHVNERAHAADKAADFSARIRALPPARP